MKYIDDNGLVSPNGNVTGNGLMYTAEYLVYRNDLTMKTAIMACQDKLGKFYRTPAKKDCAFGHQSVDDLLAISTVLPVAWSIQTYMKKHLGWYPTTNNPNDWYTWQFYNFYFQTFLARFRDFNAHLTMCQDNEPCKIDAEIWKHTVTSHPKDQDGWRKTYFYVYNAFRKDMFVNECLIWAMNLRRYYPNGIGQVRRDYWSWVPNIMEHPNVRFGWNDFVVD